MKFTRKPLHAVLFAALLGSLCAPLAAQERDRTFVGYGRLLTNDLLGDGHDRWQTGSLQTSRVWAPHRSDIVPTRFGDMIEFRLNAQVTAPWDLTRRAFGDRKFGTALTFGVHTHFQPNHWEYSLGLETSILGKKNGLETIQSTIHDLVGADQPSQFVTKNQIKSQVLLGGVAEASRDFDFSDRLRMVPFAELRLGMESLVRFGADINIGHIAKRDFAIRDAVTGFKYATVIHPEQGTSFILGADTAFVQNSAFLPSDGWAQLTNIRHRVRAGVLHKGKRIDWFYGATWLSPEFDQQASGQIVGSLRIDLKF